MCGGVFSPAGSALPPTSQTPPPAAGSACSCPAGPYRRRPPEHDETKHVSLQRLTLGCGGIHLSHAGIQLCIQENQRRIAADLALIRSYLLQNHLHPRVISHRRRHGAAARCHTQTVKAQCVAPSIMNAMSISVGPSASTEPSCHGMRGGADTLPVA